MKKKEQSFKRRERARRRLTGTAGAVRRDGLGHRTRPVHFEMLEDRRLLAINIDLDQPAGATIERVGWDLKGWAWFGNQAKADQFHENGANILRIPFFMKDHAEDGSIDMRRYTNRLRDTHLAIAANPDIEIFASLKLHGADTFPSWMDSTTSCNIFGNSVKQPRLDAFVDTHVNYIEFLRQNNIKVDYLGISNETNHCITSSYYTDAVISLRQALIDSGIPEEYRSFQYVGAETFWVRGGVSFLEGINNLPDTTVSDVVDVVGAHFYHGSPDRENDLTALNDLGGGSFWFTEAHMNPANLNNGQTAEDNFGRMRHGAAMVFEANRYGANTIIWWNQGHLNNFDDVIKHELNGTMIGATPVLSTDTTGIDVIQPYTDDDSAPLYQTFRKGDHVTIWVANGWESTMSQTFHLGDNYQVVGDVTAQFWVSDGADGIPNDIDAQGTLSPTYLNSRTSFEFTDIPSDSFTMMTFTVAPLGDVTGHVFYDGSVFDTFSNDAAIAPGKTLLETGTATTANYTSHPDGITGIMLDVTELTGVPTLADLRFHVGNDDSPQVWTSAVSPSFNFRPGQGDNSSDRIELIWPAGNIVGQWLQVTVVANESIRLPGEVLYVGNAPGDTMDRDSNAFVNAFDFAGPRDNGRTELDPAAIDNRYDFNRDTRVDATDMMIARDNVTDFTTALRLINISAPPVLLVMANSRDSVERLISRVDDSFGNWAGRNSYEDILHNAKTQTSAVDSVLEAWPDAGSRMLPNERPQIGRLDSGSCYLDGASFEEFERLQLWAEL